MPNSSYKEFPRIFISYSQASDVVTRFHDVQNPIEHVAVRDAEEFIRRLNEQEDLYSIIYSYRLPNDTETLSGCANAACDPLKGNRTALYYKSGFRVVAEDKFGLLGKPLHKRPGTTP